MKPNRKLLQLENALHIDPKKMAAYLEDFIKKYISEQKKDGVILGLSWGIDSAVVAALCRNAIDSKDVLALIMPEKDSPKNDVKDALFVAENLWIEKKVIHMTPYLRKIGSYKLFLLDRIPFLPLRFKNRIIKKINALYKEREWHLPFLDSLSGTSNMKYRKLFNQQEAYGRIKHRMRLVLLYFYGERYNKLVVGWANKTEHMTGYFVKNGCDAISDIMPIMNLYKTQVFALAEFLWIPQHIIDKPPTGGILGNASDETAIGLSYRQLDLILVGVEKGRNNEEIAEALDIEVKTILYVKELIKKSEHMRHVYAPD